MNAFMPKSSEPSRPLVKAVQTFDDVLARHARATKALMNLSLATREELGKAEENLKRLADIETELSTQMQAFQTAVLAAGNEQQAEAEKVAERAVEVGKRRTLLNALDSRLALAIEGVARVRVLVDSIKDAGGVGAARGEISEQLAQLIDAVQKVIDDAKGQGFDDVARDAHALRQQLDNVLRRAQDLPHHLPS
jgi:hypothetical protein